MEGLFYAIETGSLELVDIHLKRSNVIAKLRNTNQPTYNYAGHTALTLACSVATPNKCIIETLIQYGAPLDQRNTRGFPAIYYVAIEKNNRELVGLLMGYGVNIHVYIHITDPMILNKAIIEQSYSNDYFTTDAIAKSINRVKKWQELSIIGIAMMNEQWRMVDFLHVFL